MIDLDLVEMEINRLEAEDINYMNCAKLADLYSVRDHFQRYSRGYSYGQSEFLQACGKAPMKQHYALLMSICNASMHYIQRNTPQ